MPVFGSASPDVAVELVLALDEVVLEDELDTDPGAAAVSEDAAWWAEGLDG